MVILDATTALGAILAIVALGMIVLGTVMLRRRVPVWFRGISVTGTIVRWEYRRGHPGSFNAIHAPWVRFTDRHGTSHDILMDRGHTDRRGRFGTPRAIRYDPKAPTNAFEDTVFSLWILPLIPLTAGVFVVLLAAGVLFGR